MKPNNYIFELTPEHYEALVRGNGTQFRDGETLYCVSVTSGATSAQESFFEASVMECSRPQTVILNPAAEPVRALLNELIKAQKASDNTVAMVSFKTELATAS